MSVCHWLHVLHHIDFRTGPDGAKEVPFVEVRALVEASDVAHKWHTVAYANADLVVPVLAATDIGVCYTELVVSKKIRIVKKKEE